MRRRQQRDPLEPLSMPGVFVCGDLIVRVDQRDGETYWAGPEIEGPDVQVIRSCMCGGWRRAAPELFARAGSHRVLPRPPGLCPDAG